VEGEYCERIESMGGVIENKITKVAEETRKAGGYLKKKYEHSYLQASLNPVPHTPHPVPSILNVAPDRRA
jgi:hypothetical protein